MSNSNRELQFVIQIVSSLIQLKSSIIQYTRLESSLSSKLSSGIELESSQSVVELNSSLILLLLPVSIVRIIALCVSG